MEKGTKSKNGVKRLRWPAAGRNVFPESCAFHILWLTKPDLLICLFTNIFAKSVTRVSLSRCPFASTRKRRFNVQTVRARKLCRNTSRFSPRPLERAEQLECNIAKFLRKRAPRKETLYSLLSSHKTDVRTTLNCCYLTSSICCSGAPALANG